MFITPVLVSGQRGKAGRSRKPRTVTLGTDSIGRSYNSCAVLEARVRWLNCLSDTEVCEIESTYRRLRCSKFSAGPIATGFAREEGQRTSQAEFWMHLERRGQGLMPPCAKGSAVCVEGPRSTACCSV